MMPNSNKNKHLNDLNFELHWYGFREILGKGGFGITYVAYNRNLTHEVAIKEYMPVDLASHAPHDRVVPISPKYQKRYEWGRKLAQFEHPKIL
jgi:serine/threonine protein kinase